MNSHLDRFDNWMSLAQSAQYRPEELARLGGVSLRHLERYFRERFGKAPHFWLNELRLQEACDRLRRGYLVKHVAYELGFKDAPHFCRKFKGHYGLSPLAFLAQVAEMSLSDN